METVGLARWCAGGRRGQAAMVEECRPSGKPRQKAVEESRGHRLEQRAKASGHSMQPRTAVMANGAGKREGVR
ncbi:hypothetical protein ROSMUCSMR3_02456 [Roseovarius mucosus]|uniref:Uncharacterized protein n=1 Tax=Roseovarius mucosus TaxID=215743 RepID=A0A1V0RQJ9_9RHOB|nr:hypothetical protein ROSMUCSMR3_02456 [Roseovarius mucosus]